MNIVFMGTPEFARIILAKLITSGHDIVMVVTQPDKPTGRKKTMMPSPVKVLAQKHHLPVFQPAQIRKDYQPVLATKAELIVTAAYGQMLPADLLNQIPAINVHGSLLPAYRGGAPIQHALFDGREMTGVTVMRMKMKMDSGAIIRQKSTTITDQDDYESLAFRLAEIGADLLDEVLLSFKDGIVVDQEQDESLVTYAKTLRYEDEHIDFSQSALMVRNRLRGLSPQPGGHATINGMTIKIFRASVLSADISLPPGTVLETTRRLIVKTLDAAVAIEELQIPGKKKMAVRDFLNGQTLIKVGDIFTGKDENEWIPRKSV